MPPKQTNCAIIVDKTGTLKTTSLKEYNTDEFYKKCGLKTGTGFVKQTEWKVKLDGQTYYVSMYGKLEGRANMENKYDFPPPVDTKLFFGSCLLVGEIKSNPAISVPIPIPINTCMNGTNERGLINLTIDLWDKIYEKLFGGFEDLTMALVQDENEEDELETIPKSKKTKTGGYLKDGFVVDSSGSGEDNSDEDEYDDDDDSSNASNSDRKPMQEEQLILEDIGSELSEESYDYSDEEEE